MHILYNVNTEQKSKLHTPLEKQELNAETRL